MVLRAVFSFHVFVRGFAIAASCLLAGLATGAEDKPSVESMFTPPAIAGARISPDGDYVAMLSRGRDQRRSLVVLSVADLTPRIVASSKSFDIANVHWVNDQRLVFSTSEHEVGDGNIDRWPGLFAVNRDGSRMTTLLSTAVEASRARALHSDLHFAAVDRTPGSNAIYALRPVHTSLGDLKALNLVKVDTISGKETDVVRPGDSIDWLFDERGVPRLTMTRNQGKTAVFYLSPTDEKWNKLTEFDTYSGAGFSPLGFDGGGGLYVVANRSRDTSSLYRYDLSENKLDDKPLVSIQGYDFEGELVVDGEHKKLLGVRYLSDAWATAWLDEAHRKIQQAVDAQLPSTTNILQFARNGQMDTVLVSASSDIQPEVLLLYDVNAGKLTELGKTRPQIDPKQMSHQTMVHYAARDGLQIPAYLTLPRGAPKKNLPVVVLVHGGPYVRGNSWGWNPITQFLASRGYAVLEPEFRGSLGFGEKFAKAGWKQWGLAM